MIDGTRTPADGGGTVPVTSEVEQLRARVVELEGERDAERALVGNWRGEYRVAIEFSARQATRIAELEAERELRIHDLEEMDREENRSEIRTAELEEHLRECKTALVAAGVQPGGEPTVKFCIVWMINRIAELETLNGDLAGQLLRAAIEELHAAYGDGADDLEAVLDGPSAEPRTTEREGKLETALYGLAIDTARTTERERRLENSIRGLLADLASINSADERSSPGELLWFAARARGVYAAIGGQPDVDAALVKKESTDGDVR